MKCDLRHHEAMAAKYACLHNEESENGVDANQMSRLGLSALQAMSSKTKDILPAHQ